MALSTGAKVAIAVVGGLLLVGGGTCAGVALWLNSNADDLQAKGKVVMQEGAAFGKGKPARACVDEGLRRLPNLDGIVAEATNKVFVESCLKTATLDAAFCAGVPPRDEIMQSATWAVSMCESLGKPGDQSCSRLVGAIQQRCTKPRDGDPVAPIAAP
jgi:hypothetical protein